MTPGTTWKSQVWTPSLQFQGADPHSRLEHPPGVVFNQPLGGGLGRTQDVAEHNQIDSWNLLELLIKFHMTHVLQILARLNNMCHASDNPQSTNQIKGWKRCVADVAQSALHGASRCYISGIYIPPRPLWLSSCCWRCADTWQQQIKYVCSTKRQQVDNSQ